MPIEPTSVSKQSIREIESTSANFGSWTSMQGSSTGGKDRPVNSIWEKAISGAQKLFGSGTSESTSLKDKKDQDERAESRRSDTTALETSYDVMPGFSGRRFGSFGGAAFGGNAFGSVATSRAAPERSFGDFDQSASFETANDRRNAESELREQPAENGRAPVQEPAAKEKVVSEDGSEEDEIDKEKRLAAAASKSVSKGVTVQTPLAPSPATAQVPPATVQSELAASQQALANATVASGEQANSGAATTQPTVSQSSAAPSQNPAQSVSTPAAVAQGTPSTVAPSATPQQSTQQAASSSGTSATTTASDLSKSAATAQTAVEVTAAKPGEPAQSEVKAPVPAAPVEKPLQAVKPDAEKSQPVIVEASKKVDAPISQATAEPSTKSAAETTLAKAPSIAKDLPVEANVPESKDPLGLDAAKAKDAISEAFGKANAAKVAAPAAQPAPVAAAPQPASQGPQASLTSEASLKGQASESNAPRPAEAGLTETKDLAATDGAKRDLSAVAQQRAASAKSSVEASAQARVGNQDAAGFDAKLTQADASAKNSTGQFARESAVAAASRTQAPAGQARATAGSGTGASGTTGVNGVSGGQTLANGTTTQDAQAQQGNSKNSDGDPAAKQDFAAAMKQAGVSKGTEKNPLDGGQAFDAKVEAAATRRSEAAGKASQTSYVSKTAAEVKEVVATLTKSIDRLVTDKSGAMNLKINFEGGGSVKLRIRMEGGKVSTSMQTDVVGLEAAIKANWGELANDWNQKGVKLPPPQFQNSEAGKDSSFENLSEFASRQERQPDDRTGDGRSRNPGQASTNRGFSSGAPAGESVSSPAMERREQVISDKELKTYA